MHTSPRQAPGGLPPAAATLILTPIPCLFPRLFRSSLPAVPACSYGAFWMSLAIFTTLSAAGVYQPTPHKGDQLMLSLWGILVSAPTTAACWPGPLHLALPCMGPRS